MRSLPAQRADVTHGCRSALEQLRYTKQQQQRREQRRQLAHLPAVCARCASAMDIVNFRAHLGVERVGDLQGSLSAACEAAGLAHGDRMTS